MSEITKITGLKGATVAEQINLQNSMRPHPQMSGRGHGRLSRSKKIKKLKSAPKKADFRYMVQDVVRQCRSAPEKDVFGIDRGAGGNGLKFGWSSYDFAQSLVSQYQYFDCSLLCSYIRSNLDEMFPSFETPPTQDVILPATEVGLYFKDINDFEADEFHVYKWTEEFDEKEVMFLCNIIDPENPRNFYVVLLERHSENAQFLGTVDSEKGELELAPIWMDQDHKIAVYEAFLRIVCAALDTLNQPRLVVQKPMPLNFLQKQNFRKSTGSFAPEAWNMVSWNVEEPVVARTYEEGRGGRQALHFRRGHWRKAEEHHKNAQWSEKRNRWEKWIAGYTAGDTAFGVKKNYHLPRKEDK